MFAKLKATVLSLGKDDISTHSAALSYYTAFAIGPLFLIIISILGLLFGESAVEGKIINQIGGIIGKEAAGTIQTMIAGASKEPSGIISFVVGIVLLLLSASGLFGQLQQSLNAIWHVEQKPRKGLLTLVRERFLSFTMVLVIAFILGVSLVLSSAITVLNTNFTSLLPAPAWVLELINIFISFWIILVLFALIYKLLPDVRLSWDSVWGGATLASLLFTGGKSLIGVYVGSSAVSSTYGAAASLIALLLWVYYSGFILFVGAEYIKASVLAPQPVVVSEKEQAFISEKTQREASSFENVIAIAVGFLVKEAVAYLDKRLFHKKKSFVERVQEKLKE